MSAGGERAPAARAGRIGIDSIQAFLPHRHPFLLVDRIDEIELPTEPTDLSPDRTLGIRVLARKCITFNEAQFAGHFPGFSILPGVLVLEAMAQASSFSTYPYLIRQPEEVRRGFQCILVGVDGARFRRPVVPGDVLELRTVVVKRRGMLWSFGCEGIVDGQLVAEAEIMANMLAKGMKA